MLCYVMYVEIVKQLHIWNTDASLFWVLKMLLQMNFNSLVMKQK